MKSSPPGNQAIAQLNTAIKHHQAGQNTKALQLITRVLSKNPRFPDAHHIATSIQIKIGNLDRALYHAQQALALDPNRAEFHAAIGAVHATKRNHHDSAPHYQRALELSPTLPDALNGLAVACKETGKVSQAIDLFDQLLKLQPGNQDAIINRSLLDSNLGRAHDAINRLDEASKRFPKNPILHDTLALASSYDDQITAQQAFEFHQRFGQVLQSHIRPKPSHPNTPDPTRKLRIGYISAEFRQHSNAYFLAPILDHHDHDEFEIFLYSTNGYTDDTTKRMQAAADHWRLFKSNELRKIIDTIADDQIDILIELTGHFASNNLPALAAKPAPVQITYLGYANTTGLATIDHRIIDNTTDPAPTADSLSVESLIRLDGCFLTYEPPANTPALNDPDPARPFTFASFNDLKKLTPTTVRLWSKILDAAPGSALIIKNTQLDHSEVRDAIVARFTDLGIDESRITALGRIESIQGHLGLYNEVDLALDTFPYTGTTTTCEALAMGVPVLTLTGDTHASRVSASILNTAGLDDLCAQSTEDYIAKATRLAQDGKRTRQQRDQLRQQFADSPVCDAQSFVPKLEAAYRHAWTQWCAKHGAQK